MNFNEIIKSNKQNKIAGDITPLQSVEKIKIKVKLKI